MCAFPGRPLRIDLTRQIYATHSPKAAKSAVLGYFGGNLPIECKYTQPAPLSKYPRVLARHTHLVAIFLGTISP